MSADKTLDTQEPNITF